MKYIHIFIMLFTFALFSIQLTALAQTQADFTGNWTGKLEVQAMQLKVIFKVTQKDGTYTTLMDSPDQGGKDIPTSSTTVTGKFIEIKSAAMQMTYKGELDENGVITGEYQQGSNKLPLNLSRADGEKLEAEMEVETRPQDPKEFSYLQEEVTFKNPETDNYLAGTLTMPTSKEFEKVVILISGSGPQNRNEEIAAFNHRPFLVLSDYLTKQGIAVLRYDDRGIGESEGNFSTATSKDFAMDAMAAVNYLNQREDMQNKQIGLAGHSEGGMIAPMVAVENDRVDFIILLAGPGVPIKDLMMLQSEKMGAVSGVPKDVLDANLKMLEKAYTYLSKDETVSKDEVKAALKKIFEDNFNLYPASVQNSIADKNAFFDGQVAELTSDWFLYFIRYNPESYLSKVKCPLLAVNGEKDWQVTSKENLAGIKSIMNKTKNKSVTLNEFKNLNHMFQQCETGSANEYAQIEETFNIEAMQYIADWINNVELK